eukprot:CAMPEP_0197442060 /NCGR_PEP_ID=MMETSP1175-20131217/8161_1 /TAXON_ID=1003142 /ORGANISM="Triceratium dubium, Strain CCMP147" /LENGTH=280 /DNA_ID=CAMNT_0042972455 /DNA_START=35 /DNA_END=877 /DNA_ORIENTATION=+
MAKALILLSAIATAAAAPAIVWKNDASSPQHSSESIGAAALLKSTLEGHERDASSLASVVFMVGRDNKDGSESLSSMASSGNLPRTQAKYESAHFIHHHVGGVESSRTVARDLASAVGEEVAQLSLSEFNSMMTSSELPTAAVVSVGKDDAAALDEALVGAVENSKVHSVVLTAQRSVEEVKNERILTQRRNKAARAQRKVDPTRRRLEDQNNGNNNNQNQQNAENEEGVYYVYMTPNIFAGLLFTFFFIFVTNLGMNCMNMITISDKYVPKPPKVGREM